MRSLARWGSLPLVAMPLNSWALGLGDIESNSFLNQPLNAEIALSATEEELATLRVSLAPVDAFLQQGLEYPAFLNSVELNITQNAAGDNVIVVTSNQSIAEPFVTFLVEVSHARGAITREYSVLLDPPLFLPPGADAPQIAAPVALEPAQDVAGGQIERAPEPVAAEPAAVQPEVFEPVVTAEIPSQPEPVATAAETGTDYTVQGGDTLWDIASTVRPGGVTMNQAMLSIYEANPSAFDGNINRLRRGAILRIPPSTELGSLTAASATAEVQRQIDIWRNEVEATPQLVLLPPSEDALAGAAAAGGANTGAVSALEGQVSNLEAELAAAEAELAETRRLLELRSEELADLQVQLGDGPATEIAPDTAVSDAAVADDPLAGLESEPLFVDDLESEAAVDAGVGEAPEAQAADAAADDAAPAETATTSSAPVVFAESEPSLIERILGFLAQPIVLIAGGVIAVVLAALAFLRRRRDGGADDVTGQWQALESEMEEEFDHSATTQLNQLDEESNMVVVEGPDDSLVDTDTDFGATAAIEAIGSDVDENDASIPGTELIETLTDESFEDETELLDIVEPTAEADAEPEPELADQTMSSQTIINLDQADPIAEADFHMAYGLYDQAADLIARALEAEPGDRELKLKLLEVYFVWGNKDEFLATAMGLREEIGGGGNADWDKVVIMGKQICPDETLFSEATTASPEIDLTLEASGVVEGLDFAFGEEGEGAELDLDILEEDEAAPAETSFTGTDTFSGDQVAEEAGEFLDIGERTQAGLKAAFFEDIADDESLAPEVDDVDIAGAIGDAESSEDTALEAELEDLEVTQETPYFESESGDYADSPTLEAPTVETDLGAPTLAAPGMDSPTVETPAMDEATLETPAFDPEALEDFEEVEAAEIDEELAVEAEAEAEARAEAKVAATSEVSSVRLAAAGGGTDMTAEIEIDDLGLDVGDVGEFDDLEITDDSGDEAFSDLMLDQPEADADDAEQLSATGITKVLDQPDDVIDAPADDIGDDDATVMSPGFDIEATGSSTEVLEQPVGDFDPVQPASDDDLNFDDFSSALEGADTVERPAAYGFGGASSLAAGGADESPSEQTGTTQIGPIDPQAMSEVGTKLDLARAYIDMGDPEGARSILDEVLNEGNDSQKSEAQSLLDSL